MPPFSTKVSKTADKFKATFRLKPQIYSMTNKHRNNDTPVCLHAASLKDRFFKIVNNKNECCVCKFLTVVDSCERDKLVINFAHWSINCQLNSSGTLAESVQKSQLKYIQG